MRLCWLLFWQESEVKSLEKKLLHTQTELSESRREIQRINEPDSSTSTSALVQHSPVSNHDLLLIMHWLYLAVSLCTVVYCELDVVFHRLILWRSRSWFTECATTSTDTMRNFDSIDYTLSPNPAILSDILFSFHRRYFSIDWLVEVNDKWIFMHDKSKFHIWLWSHCYYIDIDTAQVCSQLLLVWHTLIYDMITCLTAHSNRGRETEIRSRDEGTKGEGATTHRSRQAEKW